MTDQISPFRIAIPQRDLDDLVRRLDTRRLPDDLPNAGWEYGVAAGFLTELADYWRSGYDWRGQERRLNELPQFTTEIDGQTVHFAHVRSPEPDALPLLLNHGWPSTFADFLEIVGPLSDPRAYGEQSAPAFHVIAPSLPGFGFSGPTSERGWNVERIARAWAELTRRLGYDRYLAQGGDWGGLIAPELGRVDREHVLGVHVNALIGLATIDWQAQDRWPSSPTRKSARSTPEWPAGSSDLATPRSSRPVRRPSPTR